MTSELTVVLVSLPDREMLVAEIYSGNTQVAEINQEGGEPVLELYPNPEGGEWVLPLGAFLAALQEATQRLLGNDAAH